MKLTARPHPPPAPFMGNNLFHWNGLIKVIITNMGSRASHE